jgi:hypothetical protein
MFLEKLRSEPASQDHLQKFLIHSGVVHCLKVVRNSSFHFLSRHLRKKWAFHIIFG